MKLALTPSPEDAVYQHTALVSNAKWPNFRQHLNLDFQLWFEFM